MCFKPRIVWTILLASLRNENMPFVAGAISKFLIQQKKTEYFKQIKQQIGVFGLPSALRNCKTFIFES